MPYSLLQVAAPNKAHQPTTQPLRDFVSAGANSGTAHLIRACLLCDYGDPRTGVTSRPIFTTSFRPI